MFEGHIYGNTSKPTQDMVMFPHCSSKRGKKMREYKDIGGDSGVAAFESNHDAIAVTFKDQSKYLYTLSSVGPIHLANMKRLAEKGDGLNSYINRNVRKKYAAKLR